MIKIIIFGDIIMSVPPDQMQKGYFHQWTGVPFWTTLSGNRSAYLEINNQIESVKKNEVQQLRLQHPLENQHKELIETELVLRNGLKQNLDDVAQMKMLEKEAQETLKKVEFNSPFSTEPRIPTPTDLLKKGVGLIPWIGTAYTGYQVVDYKLKHDEATRVLETEKEAVSDIQKFGESIQEEFDKNRDLCIKVREKLEAQRKIVNGLQILQNELKEKQEKL